jgi:DNA-binding transcriptional MerR regulator
LDKAPGAFRTISEVADEIDVPQHVLRFWESRFAQIRPMKRGGGRRFYRPEDVDLLRGVRHLLYGEGYTIRGVQRILREQGVGFVQDVWRAGAQPPPPPSDEDRAEDEGDVSRGAEAASGAPSIFGFAAARERSEEVRAPARREPSFAPPDAGKPKPATLSSDQRRQLHAALDDLVACRGLLEVALADDGSANGDSANGGRNGGGA